MRGLQDLPSALLALIAVALPLASADELKIETTVPATCTRSTRVGDVISVNYRGTLESTGEQFDASFDRDEAFSFTLGGGQVIKGWDQGLLDMCPGEGRRLIIPSELGYGRMGAWPKIPGGATLIFETELVSIKGVEEEESITLVSSFVAGTSISQTAEEATATTGDSDAIEDAFTIATAPPEPPKDSTPTEDKTATPAFDPVMEAKPIPPTESASPEIPPQAECHLLGPFALIVQGALGIVALLSLVYKRWRETPKRPWKIWFFDVSKQVVGSMLLHGLNLLMSMFGAGDIENASQTATIQNSEDVKSQAPPDKTTPNPCSFYLLNLGIDVSRSSYSLSTIPWLTIRRPRSVSPCSSSSSNS